MATEISDWVFESVLQFLKSPMWTAPIDAFLDEHCTTFDPDLEECKLEYTALHNQFRDMVDELLSSFLGELGVDVAAFVEAIKTVEGQSEQAEISAMLSEYLVAIDDFTTFRSMMEHRTTELEVEAMEEHRKYVAKNNGNTEDDASTTGCDEDESDIDDDERFLIEMAIHASLGTEEMMMKQLAEEDAKLLKELAFQIAVEHEKALKEMLAAEAKAKQEDEATVTEAAAQAMEAKKKEIEAEEQRKIAALQAEVEKQRAAKVEETLAKLHAETASAPTEQRKALGDLVHGGANSRNNCSVFGAQKSALPSLPAGGANTTAKPQPLSEIVSQKENSLAGTPSGGKPQPTAAISTNQPSADEIKEREQYFKALGEKLRTKNQKERNQEVEEFASKNAIEATATENKGAVEMSEEQRQMRIQLARRFKEDLIQESRKQLS